MVFALTHDGLARLYFAPGLEPYRPEAVLVHTFDGEALPTLCYNLVEALSEYLARHAPHEVIGS